MQEGKFKTNAKRCAALLSAFIIIITFILGGCGKVEKVDKNAAPANGDDISSSSDEIITSTTEPSQKDKTSAFVTATQGSAASNNSSRGSSSAKTQASQKTQGSTNKGSTNGTTAKNPQTTEEAVYNDMAWQRKFGFNLGYDLATDLVLMNIASVRTYFTYNGYDWLIEFWKGEYELVTVGGEIGIYYHKNTSGKAPSNPRLLHYKAVENADSLYMSMDVWQCDKQGDRKVISMPRLKYWWVAAFSQGMLEKHSRRTDLIMLANIEFKDKGMLNAFVNSFKKKAFTQKTGTLTYKDADAFVVKSSNNGVQISWRYLEE